MNVELNRVRDQVITFLGDNREVGNEYLHKAHRVSMGYLPGMLFLCFLPITRVQEETQSLLFIPNFLFEDEFVRFSFEYFSFIVTVMMLMLFVVAVDVMVLRCKTVFRTSAGVCIT